MFIKNIYIKKRCYYISTTIILTLLLLLIYLCMLKKNKVQNNNLFVKEDVFNINSYYASYQATIVSNKNINSYLIDEWYKADVGHKISFMDKTGNICSYIITNNTLQIKSTNQINTLKINEFTASNVNTLSILTFIEIYNSINANNQCCEIKYYNSNDEKYIVITSSKKNNIKCKMCKLYENNKYFYSLELILNKNNIPIRYNIKDKDNNDRISIIYNKFQYNQKIEDEVFSI